MAAKSKLISHILAAFPGNDHWKTLGQFENKRTKFEWKSVVVEVDETKYPFGYGYEIEVETEQPERVKGDL